MHLQEDPNQVSLDGKTIDFQSEPNFPFYLTRHGLLGASRIVSNDQGHIQLGWPYFLQLRRFHTVSPEFLHTHGMIVLGHLGPHDPKSSALQPRFLEGVDRGRIFPRHNICAFWKPNLLNWLPPFRPLLSQYFATLQLPIREFTFEAGYPPQQELVPYDELSGAHAPLTAQQRAHERDMALMAQQHTNAAIKRMRTPPDARGSAEQARRAGQGGFDTVAAYNAARRMGDSVGA